MALKDSEPCQNPWRASCGCVTCEAILLGTVAAFRPGQQPLALTCGRVCARAESTQGACPRGVRPGPEVGRVGPRVGPRLRRARSLFGSLRKAREVGFVALKP